MLRLAVCLLCLVFTGSLARSESPAAAAFEAGRFQEAAQLALAAGGADDYALAARALMADVVSQGGEPNLCQVEQAEAYARAAIEQDPAHLEGRLQLAIALSFRARPMSLRQIVRSGLGTQAKSLAESVQADDPDNIYAMGFLAVWHIEAVRRAGRFPASLAGATVRAGRAQYRRAAAIAPDDASLHWQYAKALAALNARRYRDEIKLALTAAMAAPAETALEAAMQDRARTLAAAMERALPAKEIEALAAQML